MAKGNPCLVVPLPAAGTHSSDDPAPTADVTRCATWPAGPGRAGVNCWGPTGEPIQCCGHGLLSCASLWARHGANSGVLLAGELEIPYLQSGELAWLAFPPLAPTDTDAPAWATHVLGRAPVNTAIAGPEQGYLVLEAPADTCLDNVTPPSEVLCANTLRALILTCRANTSRYGEDIHYRYFAPQYGSPEDTATGSAMRVLASYWRRRGMGEELSALQCSAPGGWLQSRLEEGITWVGGYVTPQEPGTSQ